MTESTVQQDICRTFGALPWLRIWRSNAGAARFGRQVVRFGLPGQADLSGILSGGRRLEIECKKPGGRQSREQRAFQRVIESFGGVYILATCVDDVWKGLRAKGVTGA